MNLTKTHQWMVGAVLMLVMALTRSHHMATTVHLPDASWAVFFLAAFYLRSLWPFAVFMAAAWLIDLSAVKFAGVSAYCLTPAYFTLVAAYGALWSAGLWYAGVHRQSPATLPGLLGSFVLGVALCELFSHGGFYVFSGYFEPNWSEYAVRTVEYFPSFLASALLYLFVAALIHAFVSIHGYRTRGRQLDGRA